MYDGGFYLNETRLVRSGSHNGHTSDLVRPFSDKTLSCINTLQDTPWRVNSVILEVAQQAWTGRVGTEGRPAGQ
jgi:DNA-directed RNA polymerase